MIQKFRKQFNDQFTQKKYQDFMDDIASDFDYLPAFRMAETLFFISNTFKFQLIESRNDVIKLIEQDNFNELKTKI